MQGVSQFARRMSRHNPQDTHGTQDAGRRTQGMLISRLPLELSLFLKAFRHGDARSRATVRYGTVRHVATVQQAVLPAVSQSITQSVSHSCSQSLHQLVTIPVY